MTDNEIEMLNDEDALIEYCGNLYEFVAVLGMHYVFSDINNGDTVTLSRNSLKEYCYIVHRSELTDIERGI